MKVKPSLFRSSRKNIYFSKICQQLVRLTTIIDYQRELSLKENAALKQPNCETCHLGRNSVIKDTAGQEKYNAIAPVYYREALGAIIVYEITSRESF